LILTNKSGSLTGKRFSKISIGLASPDSILARSYGEVLKPETINYRSFKPEKDGLFCEKIFGPVRDWECHCGKYKRVRYKGIICDRCGVEVTLKSVRRERMGHIVLATPVVHIWYFRSMPSKIGCLLGINSKDLEKIIYYESYIVTNPGDSGFKHKELISEEEYFHIINENYNDYDKVDKNGSDVFVAKIGGEAVKDLLKRIKLEELSKELRTQIKVETSVQRKNEALKRLKIVETFIPKEGKVVNKPEWMVLDIIPVVPPELRPLVPLEGGRFATSDLNDLYRRVIIRNNRLKKLMEIKAPEIILRNEKRMLQEALDSLFDNGKRSTAVRSDGNRPLKSLSDMLKGKQGRFRQNLLGKRVDYSGRSVIVVGPELKLYECGLPKTMAVELFKPFIIRKLVERGIVKTVKSAKKIVDRRGKEIWDILETIIEDHPVMLNRAPTLHRLGIQAFQPILVEGKAIRIHPLVCTAFNADFDGDQMAVHIPLSFEAQVETKLLMLSSHNILSPANGRPIAIPSQDIVLGCYYLTKIKPNGRGEGKIFYSPDEVLLAFNNDVIDIHSKVKVKINGEMIETTPGRIIFNKTLPERMEFVNELLSKKRIEEIVATAYRKYGVYETSNLLDRLKDIGFKYATKGGLSVGLDDVLVPPEKAELIEKAEEEVDQIKKNYEKGYLTDGERYNQVIDIWTHTSNKVSEKMFERLRHSYDGFNPIFMMADSGARGSVEQIRQLAGMRGLMAKPQKSMTGRTGEIIEDPIIANFKDGLSVLEYFISTHGARKGLADTALKTADAGYLTRRLVDVAQDVIINEEDCGTILGIEITALKEGEEIIEPLHDRILGRVAVDDIIDPITDEVLVESSKMIEENDAQKISETAIESVKIRSVLTCESKRGVCAKCYGRNLGTGKLVDIGEAVGVIAAQSIGEPGTQLTLRTFHIGGTASRIAVQSEATAKYNGRVKYENLKCIVQDNGRIIALCRNGKIHIIDENNRIITRYVVTYGANILVKDGDSVKKGQVLFRWDPYSGGILSENSGHIKFADIKEDMTFREELDDQTGLKQKVIIESRNRNLNPRIQIISEEGKRLGNYILPTKSRLMVKEGDFIKAGDILVKIAKDITKTKDITGGLPRVAELFEARKPKDPAVVCEIDGVVRFGQIKRGVRELVVTGRQGDQKSYLIPYGKHVLVQDGDEVTAGERLTDGSVAPHDILRIKGPNAVQEYLVNEIQEVYRLQGVRINDKHIEIIVRQMMQRIKIEDPGDTDYLEGDQMDKHNFLRENQKLSSMIVITEPGDTRFKIGDLVNKYEIDRVNERIKKQKKQEVQYRSIRPATFQPLLLGITQGSLSTDSFISAASFQETTKVLTDAAIEGKVDYLVGLKENVIMGNLIPAGTGLKKYEQLRVGVKEETYISPEELKEESIKEFISTNSNK
jgi:DNA-directed RNA polymerase subunit beta'